jgi:single-stranded-DNA-specific exonuclease
MWKILSPEIQEIQEKYLTGILSSKVLAASDLSEEQIHELLDHDMTIHTSQAVCVQKACARILEAKKKKEKVFVGGDYDCDGICSTAIMKATLDALKIPNGYYIPDRFQEGYGLKPDIVAMAHQKGYSLVITVDNGVKAHDALKKAAELGMDTIVTDHHQIEEEVESEIVVHPDYLEDQFAYLSGAGVALQISRTLIGNNDLLSVLAGVAAVGDVMPLWRETRRLVNFAVSSLQKGQPHVLADMLYPGALVNETAIAFNIVPKLNCASRLNEMISVNKLVPFLLAGGDTTRAGMQLNHVNDMRKQLSARETALALKQVGEEPFEIIYDPSLHIGICGIIAGKIADQFHKPVLVLTDYQGTVKGSGRSVEGFDLFSFLSDIPYKTEFGGHPMACGITIDASHYKDFEREVRTRMKASGWVYHEAVQTALAIDPDDVNFDAIMDLERLSPFPKEIQAPVFALEDMEILARKETSGTIRYRIANASGGFDATIFRSRGIAAPDHPRRLYGRLTINRWRGRVTPQMTIDAAE